MNNFPNELLSKILDYLENPQDIFNTTSTCKNLYLLRNKYFCKSLKRNLEKILSIFNLDTEIFNLCKVGGNYKTFTNILLNYQKEKPITLYILFDQTNSLDKRVQICGYILNKLKEKKVPNRDYFPSYNIF